MKQRNKLKILRFINSNPKWREVLSSSPYHITIKDYEGYTLLKYNQLFCDFNQQMVREARSLIIKKVGYRYIPVAIPFTKFFAVGDPHAKHDLQKLYKCKKWYITEKIDGSIIIVWWDNGMWHTSTSGTISAYNAPLQFPMNGLNTYGELFDYASQGKIDYSKLDKRYTYIFELVGMENKVIVPYEHEDIYYLGKRNNYTLYETSYFEDDLKGVEKCKRPRIHTIEFTNNPKDWLKVEIDDVNQKGELKFQHFEGVVLGNKNLIYRVKIKSNAYLQLASQKGNGIFTPKRILVSILEEKDDDILSAFPEYKPQFDTIRRLLCVYITQLKSELQKPEYFNKDKKELAKLIQNNPHKWLIFKAVGIQYNNMNEEEQAAFLESAIYSLHISNLLNNIGVDNDGE